MKTRDKIIYWVATIWLSLGMATSGIVQLIPMNEEIERMNALGYPNYFLTIIGVWKMLGIVAILIPKYPLVKEWAYAGFFFLLSGAIFTHLAAGDAATEYFGPTLLLVLTIVSWFYRPADRKLSTRKV
ncbi:MAG: DoxX family protein [Cyclobacteriaceae bacterium]|nr:DoxX family protein [Cyclobacteriaceae bacterium]